MSKLVTAGCKVVLSYLLAGMAYLLYFKWPHYTGHAHVPFSGFPEFLLWSPIAPYFLLEELLAGSSKSLIGLLVFTTVFVCALWLFLRRKGDA